MDKFWEGVWSVAAPFIGLHAWMTLPLAVMLVLAYKSPELLTEFLSHRREMRKMNVAEQRRQKSVDRRRTKAEHKAKRER